MKELVDRFRSLIEHVESSRAGLKRGLFPVSGI